MVISGVLALLFQVASPAVSCSTTTDTWPTRKWQVTEPDAVGLDRDSLKAVVTRARAIPGVTSIMVVRHGQIALEEYFHGGGRNTPAPVASITKSVTSYLVGIALERGLIDSLDQPLIDLVPQVAPPRGNARSITIRELLTMTSGLSEQWYLEKPEVLRVVTTPGSTFRYSNEAVQFLVRAMAQASDEDLLKFSREVLWEPLNIDINEGRWPRYEMAGSPHGAFGLRLTARELGKLGLLALRGGCWEGKQVVPATYLQQAMRKQVSASSPEPSDRGYGFLWWITPQGIPYMAGQGGQYVVVLPDLDLVTVITADGNAPEPDYLGQFQLVTQGITNALK